MNIIRLADLKIRQEKVSKSKEHYEEIGIRSNQQSKKRQYQRFIWNRSVELDTYYNVLIEEAHESVSIFIFEPAKLIHFVTIYFSTDYS